MFTWKASVTGSKIVHRVRPGTTSSVSRRRAATSITDTVQESRIPGSPTCATSKRPRPGSWASPLGRTPTATLSTVSSAPGRKMPTVFSPRLDVKIRSGLSAASAPATAGSPGIEPTWRCVRTSMTSTASLAVWAT